MRARERVEAVKHAACFCARDVTANQRCSGHPPAHTRTVVGLGIHLVALLITRRALDFVEHARELLVVRHLVGAPLSALWQRGSEAEQAAKGGQGGRGRGEERLEQAAQSLRRGRQRALSLFVSLRLGGRGAGVRAAPGGAEPRCGGGTFWIDRFASDTNRMRACLRCCARWFKAAAETRFGLPPVGCGTAALLSRTHTTLRSHSLSTSQSLD